MLTTQAQDKLLSQEIDKTLDSGNTLLMKFEELERGSNFSIARVTIESGTSIGSVPHVFEGFRRIGEMRDMKFMIPLQEWRDDTGNKFYKFGYADSQTVDIAETFGSDVHPDVIGQRMLPVESR